jgi:hypothetical protein
MAGGYRFGRGDVYGGLGRGLEQGAKNFAAGLKERQKLAAAALKAEGQAQGALILFKQAHDSGYINDEQYAKLLQMKPEQQAAAIGSVHAAAVAAAEQQNRESIRAMAVSKYNEEWNKREAARQNALAGPGAGVRMFNGVPYRLDTNTGQYHYAPELLGPSPPDPYTHTQIPGTNQYIPNTDLMAKAIFDTAHPEVAIRQQTGLSPQQILEPIVYDKEQGKYTSPTQRGDIVEDKDTKKKHFQPSSDPNVGDTVSVDGTIMPYSQYATHQRKLSDAGFFAPPSSNLPPEEQQLQALLQRNLQRSIQSGAVSGPAIQGVAQGTEQGAPPPVQGNLPPPAPVTAPQNVPSPAPVPPPPEAVAYLIAHPETGDKFDEMFQSPGYASQILSAQGGG